VTASLIGEIEYRPSAKQVEYETCAEPRGGKAGSGKNRRDQPGIHFRGSKAGLTAVVVVRGAVRAVTKKLAVSHMIESHQLCQILKLMAEIATALTIAAVATDASPHRWSSDVSIDYSIGRKVVVMDPKTIQGSLRK